MPWTRASLVLVALILAGGVPAPGRSAPPPREVPPRSPALFRPGASGRSRLRILRGVPVVTLEGSPRQIGRAHGALLRDALAFCVEGYLDPILGGAPPAGLAALAQRMAIPDWAQEEMRGIAEGSGLPYEKVLLANTVFDIKKLLLCSAVCAGGDPPLFGRNLDYPDGGGLARATAVFAYRTPGGKTFASVGFPGLVGVLTGWNEAGLAVAVLEVFGRGFRGDATPYAMLLREILQGDATIEEAVARLRRARISTGNNVAAMDAGGAAVLEISPRRVVVRRARGPVIYATNHFLASVHRQPGDWRDGILARAAELGVRDRRQLQDLLGRVAFRALTVQSMVMVPSAGELWLGCGGVPATRRPYVHLGPEDMIRVETRGEARGGEAR